MRFRKLGGGEELERRSRCLETKVRRSVVLLGRTMGAGGELRGAGSSRRHAMGSEALLADGLSFDGHASPPRGCAVSLSAADSWCVREVPGSVCRVRRVSGTRTEAAKNDVHPSYRSRTEMFLFCLGLALQGRAQDRRNANVNWRRGGAARGSGDVRQGRHPVNCQVRSRTRRYYR